MTIDTMILVEVTVGLTISPSLSLSLSSTGSRCLLCSAVSTLAYLSDVSFCYGNGRFKQLMGNLHKDFINIAENTKYFDRTGR